MLDCFIILNPCKLFVSGLSIELRRIRGTILFQKVISGVSNETVLFSGLVEYILGNLPEQTRDSVPTGSIIKSLVHHAGSHEKNFRT
jgi:hypothetical protein